MSFVLEALKKHEADRSPDAAAALAVAALQHRRHRVWAGVAVAALLVNAVVLAWFLGGPWLQPGPPPAAEVSPAEAPLAAVAPPAQPADAPPEQPAPATAVAPALAMTAPVAPVADSPAPVAEAVVAPQPAPPVPRLVRLALQDLPSDTRRRFPGIAFSTHIYAEDPDLRAVVANGQRLIEGDRVRGLVIEEISASGVTLRFEDFLVDVPLVADWDTP
jgi:general secretion pathway protein B